MSLQVKTILNCLDFVELEVDKKVAERIKEQNLEKPLEY
jgi:hypothetical protein